MPSTSLSAQAMPINAASALVSEADANSAENDVMHLLVPIRRSTDVIAGARYAKKMMEYGKRIKIILLHVTKPRQEETSLHSLSNTIDRIEEQQAEALLKEAALYLNECRISHRTYLICGDVVFSILDAAELLNSDAIVLPAAKRRSWLRPFSSDIVGKITHAARSIPVVLVDSDGLVSNGSPKADIRHKQKVQRAIGSL